MVSRLLEPLEQRVLMSSTSIPDTHFFLPDGNPIEVIGGEAYGVGGRRIQNGDISTLEDIRCYTKSVIVKSETGQPIDITNSYLGTLRIWTQTNMKTISLGDILGKVDIATFTNSPKYSLETITTVGNLSGKINTLGTGALKITAGSISNLNIYSKSIASVISNSYITNTTINSPLKVSNVTANSINNLNISSKSIDSIISNSHIIDTIIEGTSKVGKVIAGSIDRSKITSGVSSSNIQQYVWSGKGNIGTITASNISNSIIYGVSPDAFSLVLNGIKQVVKPGMSFKENGNDIKSMRTPYTLKEFTYEQLGKEDSGIEYRFYKSNRHFLSIIEDYNTGSFVIRPHPGTDKNGWGSSLYMQPFITNAEIGIGVESIKFSVGENDISFIKKSDSVLSLPIPNATLKWDLEMTLSFDEKLKSIFGTGTYSIDTGNSLSVYNEDLNLCKIATNYLVNVPIIKSNSLGNTGDMSNVNVKGGKWVSEGVEAILPEYSWNPVTQPAYFPQDLLDTLTINVAGNYNNVDTKKQGYGVIKAAYKPSLELTLASQNSNTPMIFGAMYDTTKSQDFWEDNVGITPLILRNSSENQFVFNVSFASQALPKG